MKIIDFHTHIFPDRIADKTIPYLAKICQEEPHTDGKENGLKDSMEMADILCSVILPVVTAPAQFRSINEFASRFQESPMISFGGIHPDSLDYKAELRYIKELGLKGIKLHPDYQDTYFNDIRYKRIVSYATELDLIISVHAGLDPKCPNDVHCTPAMAEEVITEVRPEKLILAHMGGNGMYQEVAKHLIGRDVFLDTSYVLDKIEKEYFLRMIKDHGEGKILFATDTPWAGQKEFVTYLENLELADSVKHAIFYKNAAKLLGLEGNIS